MSGLAYSILSGFAVIPVFFGMTPYFPVKFNFFDEIFGSFFLVYYYVTWLAWELFINN